MSSHFAKYDVLEPFVQCESQERCQCLSFNE